MLHRRPFLRYLVVVGLVAAGLVAVVGGLALRGPGVVAVAVAGALAACLGWGTARESTAPVRRGDGRLLCFPDHRSGGHYPAHLPVAHDSSGLRREAPARMRGTPSAVASGGAPWCTRPDVRALRGGAPCRRRRRPLRPMAGRP